MTTPQSEPATPSGTVEAPSGGAQPLPQWGRAASIAALLAAAAVLTLWGLGDRGLWSAHEARAARVASTMLETGDWVVPQLSPGEPTYQKPPLYYWLVAVTSWAFGGEVTPWATRLPSAVALMATVLLVYLFARDLKGHRAGLISGAVLLTCVRLMWVSRVAVLDPLLMLWVTLALVLFHRAVRRRASWRGYLPMAVPVALGILTKGPLGAVLPGVVVVVFLIWETFRSDRRVFLRTAGRCLPAVGLCLALAAPWFVAVHVRTGGDFTLEFFVYHHLCRSGRIELAEHPGSDGVEPEEAAWTDYLRPGRNGYLVYRALTDRGLDNRRFEGKTRWTHYVSRIWGNAFPWSLFLPGALAWAAVRRRRWAFEPAMAYPVVWFAAGLVLLSLMKFRKSEYILPMYPALAVLVGVFLAEYERLRGQSRLWDWLLRLAFAGLCAFAVVLGAGLLALLDGGVTEWALGKMGNENDRFMFARVHTVMAGHLAATVAAVAALLAAFAAALWLWVRGRAAPALALVAGGVAALFLVYSAVLVPVIDDGRSHKAFVAQVAERAGLQDVMIAACGEDHELYYLLGRQGLAPLRSPDARAWLAGESVADALRRARDEGRGAYVIVRRHRTGGLELGPECREVVTEKVPHTKPLALWACEPQERSR